MKRHADSPLFLENESLTFVQEHNVFMRVEVGQDTPHWKPVKLIAVGPRDSEADR